MKRYFNYAVNLKVSPYICSSLFNAHEYNRKCVKFVIILGLANNIIRGWH